MVRLIEYGTAEHEEMILLRNKILREPLGLVFSEEELLRERTDFLIGYYDDDKLAGCCVLSPVNKFAIQLRQMSVDTLSQKRGVGCSIITFSEKLSRENGFEKIILHARKEAVGFYRQLGYAVIGDEFIEVGIPHYNMEKQL